MKRVFPFILFTCLLISVLSSQALGQSDKPPQPGTPYVGDAVPTAEMITKNYEHLGPDCRGVQVIGIHKASDLEYKIISNNSSGGKGTASDILYDLWRLESGEWVMVRPGISVIMHIKVLYY